MGKKEQVPADAVFVHRGQRVCVCVTTAIPTMLDSRRIDCYTGGALASLTTPRSSTIITATVSPSGVTKRSSSWRVFAALRTSAGSAAASSLAPQVSTAGFIAIISSA